MRIVLNGVETYNKGAELMLYAILQEIKRKFPDAEVFIPYTSIPQGLSYVQTSLKFSFKPLYPLIKYKVQGVLRRLGLPQRLYDIDAFPMKNVDYFIDGSGFIFSDQWNHSDFFVEHWRLLLLRMRHSGAKIVFLPQAFGPVDLDSTKKLFNYINKYSDIVMPREKISEKYLLDMNFSSDKICRFTDFTSPVKGIVPQKYLHLKNAVCVIPNVRMIDKGVISQEEYVKIIAEILTLCKAQNRKVFLLNHESIQDEELAYACAAKLNNDIKVVSGLNALEVKGLISISYACISSRFHGVASALNSSVPCIATSWSHKYAELFNDYGMIDCILDLKNLDSIKSKVSEILNPQYNSMIREQLCVQLTKIKENTKRMWQTIWDV